LRETLLKQCRDGQKASKQAIFALHRGDATGAATLLHQCANLLQAQLWPMVQKEPPLRSGSFSAVVEEYVEAKLFYVWLHGREEPSAEGSAPCDPNRSIPSGLLLQPKDFDADMIPLEADEYLGGLCDLTGEIGRYAVLRGTVRDVVGVQQCWRTNKNIATALESLSVARLLPGNHLFKKLDGVRHSVQKIERMLYELSLSEATGRAFQSEAASMVTGIAEGTTALEGDV
jgi:predicted translin family RNA/ssDNA-binding protein